MAEKLRPLGGCDVIDPREAEGAAEREVEGVEEGAASNSATTRAYAADINWVSTPPH
jgi:hypothetical protein